MNPPDRECSFNSPGQATVAAQNHPTGVCRFEFMNRILHTIILLAAFCLSCSQAWAQDGPAPLTNQEFVKLVQQLPTNPAAKQELITAIRERGLGFVLTNGLRSLVATKSGNDALLRRTLEEAARRRENPAASALPPAAEGRELLDHAREATKAATEGMPDFTVKQLISRYHSPGGLNNWTLGDRLTVAVSYRQTGEEEYKLLAINDLPYDKTQTKGGYQDAGGTSSTGEFVTVLSSLFAEESNTKFTMADTDTLRGRRAVVFEYEVKTENSRQSISAPGLTDKVIVTGYRGRVWIDRETYRVLRVESVANDIPADYPITAASRVIDYDWVKINEREYLLPTRADVQLAARIRRDTVYSRNAISFRGYRKFGAEVKIIEEDDPLPADEPPPTQPAPPAKPQPTPAAKPTPTPAAGDDDLPPPPPPKKPKPDKP
jgi:hypothetical protein